MKLKILATLLGIMLLIVSGVGCEAENNDGSEKTSNGLEQISDVAISLDTQIEITVQAKDHSEGEKAIDAAKSEISRLEDILSRHIEDSEVYEINDQAGRGPVQVSDETYEVVEYALGIGDLTQGHFDITISPVLDLWGFGGNEHRIPKDEEINNTLELVDKDKVELKEDEQTVFLPESDMKIDLGGSSKGFILDRAAEVLEEYDIESAMIDGGGDIRTIGPKHDGSPWRIGIRHPRTDDYFSIAELEGHSIATSGDYERYFTEDGVRYHHVINPFTGKPSREVISSSVYTDKGLKRADLLSTGTFIMGIEDGLELLEELDDAEGIMVDADGNYYVTSGFDELQIREKYRGDQLNN